MSEKKEEVIVFADEATLGNELLEKEWSEGYTFSKMKVGPYQKGKLKDWLEKVKNKGTADKKQKVFFGFSTEEMTVNDIHKDFIQLRDKYPNLAVSFIYEGSSLDSIQQRLGVKTDRQIMNEDRRMLATVGISPNPNLSKQEDIIAEVKKLKAQAIKDGLLAEDKKTHQAVPTTGTFVKVEEEEAKSVAEKEKSKG